MPLQHMAVCQAPCAWFQRFARLILRKSAILEDLADLQLCLETHSVYGQHACYSGRPEGEGYNI